MYNSIDLFRLVPSSTDLSPRWGSRRDLSRFLYTFRTGINGMNALGHSPGAAVLAHQDPFVYSTPKLTPMVRFATGVPTRYWEGGFPPVTGKGHRISLGNYRIKKLIFIQPHRISPINYRINILIFINRIGYGYRITKYLINLHISQSGYGRDLVFVVLRNRTKSSFYARTYLR